MLPDTRILTRHRDYCVLWEQQAIVFKDGTTMHLHAVRKFAIDEMFLRAIRINEHWFIFDLRAIRRSFAEDIASAPARDTSGVVLYTLREHFPSVADFQVRLFANYLDIWTAEADVQQPQLRLELGDVSSLDKAGVDAVKRHLVASPCKVHAPYQRSAA